MRNWTRLLLHVGAIVGITLGALLITAYVVSRRAELIIREQAVEYLQANFESEVALASFTIDIPRISSLRLLLTRGRGALAKVSGGGLVLRHKGRRDLPPMFSIKKFTFDVDLGTIFQTPKVVPFLSLDDMEIHIPPKGERPDLGKFDAQQIQKLAGSSVLINAVEIHRGKFVIIPKDSSKTPLEFDLHHVRLESAGFGKPMNYDAELTNPRPPGEVTCRGTIGPWDSNEPADTPFAGVYTFTNADLGVFPAISGTLTSTGSFRGTIDYVKVKGQASVPDFRLEQSGNRVPLRTRFDLVVDGTNGNTTLNPVSVRLGFTRLRTSGAIIKHEGKTRRTINLHVRMPRGDLRDVLRLAMKGPPLMEGRLSLSTRVRIPPLSQNVIEKLVLDGNFHISRGRFLRPGVQDRIDTLSRRGQGQPKNQEISDVFSSMKGQFRLDNQVIVFRSLTFDVPGAAVDLKGKYDLAQDILDFHGHLKLKAKVSQTMTGVRRWLLKPVDPFMAKKGAGTYIGIKIQGSAKAPKFGHD